MTEKFESHDISPHKSFYDKLSDSERRVLLESQGYQSGSIDENMSLAEQQRQAIAIATHRITDMTPDEVIVLPGRYTLLRITIPGDIVVFSYVHEYAMDLAKLKPVMYGMSNDAIIEDWSPLEWDRAKDYALSDALKSLVDSNQDDVKVEFAHIEDGEQVSLS